MLVDILFPLPMYLNHLSFLYLNHVTNAFIRAVTRVVYIVLDLVTVTSLLSAVSFIFNSKFNFVSEYIFFYLG